MVCAAAAADLVWIGLRDAGSGFSPRDAVAAIAAIVVFAALSHLFVASAIALSERRSLWQLSCDVATPTLLNLAGNVCIGLVFAISYSSAHWTVLLFVLPLTALTLGYRATLKEERVFGCLVVTDRTAVGAFDHEDVRLLESLANELSLTLRSRRLFAEVEEERERFQHVVEAVADYAIFMIDPDGFIVSWNAGAERITGFTAQEAIGSHLSIFHPDTEQSRGSVERELQTASLQGRFESEGWRVRKDGS